MGQGFAAVMLGDESEVGIAGAEVSGISAIYITGAAKADGPAVKPDAIVSGLEEVPSDLDGDCQR